MMSGGSLYTYQWNSIHALLALQKREGKKRLFTLFYVYLSNSTNSLQWRFKLQLVYLVDLSGLFIGPDS